MKYSIEEYNRLGKLVGSIRDREHTLNEYSNALFEYLEKSSEEVPDDKVKAEQAYRKAYEGS